jgi:hypothetical protein
VLELACVLELATVLPLALDVDDAFVWLPPPPPLDEPPSPEVSSPQPTQSAAKPSAKCQTEAFMRPS